MHIHVLFELPIGLSTVYLNFTPTQSCQKTVVYPADLWAMRGKLPRWDPSWPVIEPPSVMLVNFLDLACGDNAVWLQSINGSL